MKLNIYVIKDKRSCFMTPTFDYNDAAAVRNFEHACRNVDSLFNSHPADFSMYRIGEYDTESGVITPCEPFFIVDGVGSGCEV